MTSDTTLSAVVVCYKDAETILPMYERLSSVLRSTGLSFEIIYVNDDSPDGAEQILDDLARRDSAVTVLHHSRNFGAQAAFTSGMLQASGDAVILLDGDLQDPPELITEFIRKWREGFDVVYGIRRKRERSMGEAMQRLYHLFYVLMQRLSYIPMPPDAGDFSLMDRKVVDRINALPERDRWLRGLRAWVGFRQTGIAYVRAERHTGVTTHSFIGKIRWAKKVLFSFSYVPLEWISLLATVMMILSLVGMFFYAITFFLLPDIPRGITTVYVLVLFLASVQLLSLSIIAEYIGRIFEEVKGRPRSIVREVRNDHRTKKDGPV